METINIDKINVENEYLRLDTKVEKLMKSIETVGLIHPLIINQENILIAGGRRFTALKALGHTEIPVIRVDKTNLEQELISIDENLIRKDLTNMELEKSLSRGLEIYETLYPSAKKFEEEVLLTPQDNEIEIDAPNDTRSFIDLTAEKTGLSKKVIKSAIEREEKSSNRVKDLRSHGELNATQTNELIKLEKNDQEDIADLIVGRSAKEIKDIVKKVRENGVKQTIEDVITSPQLPSEYKSLMTLLKRSNKVMGKILLEEMKSEHNEVGKLLDQISTLRISLDQFLVLCSKESTPNSITDVDYASLAQNASKMIDSEGSETNF